MNAWGLVTPVARIVGDFNKYIPLYAPGHKVEWSERQRVTYGCYGGRVSAKGRERIRENS